MFSAQNEVEQVLYVIFVIALVERQREQGTSQLVFDGVSRGAVDDFRPEERQSHPGVDELVSQIRDSADERIAHGGRGGRIRQRQAVEGGKCAVQLLIVGEPHGRDGIEIDAPQKAAGQGRHAAAGSPQGCFGCFSGRQSGERTAFRTLYQGKGSGGAGVGLRRAACEGEGRQRDATVAHAGEFARAVKSRRALRRYGKQRRGGVDDDATGES